MKGILFLNLLLLLACGKQGDKTVNVYQEPSELYPELQIGDESGAILTKKEINFPVKNLTLKKNKPKTISKRYINLTVNRNEQVRELNNIKYGKGTREISITGKHIILDDNDFQEIVMHIKGAKDLSRLTIESETLELHTKLRLFQTNVFIKTKNLVVGKNAEINTSGAQFESRAKSFENGKNGLQAGDIKIIVSDIFGLDQRREAFLIANATNGQDAGHGVNGVRGTNAVLKKQPNFYKYQYDQCHRDSHGRHKKIMAIECYLKKNLRGARSGNGGNARVGGMPGSPGKAGNIEMNLFVEDYHVQVKGSISGKQDILRVGGEPGHPITTCARYESNRRTSKTSDCKAAVRGVNVNPKIALITKTRDKVVKQINGRWFSKKIIHHLMELTNDLYLNGYNLEAQLELANTRTILTNTKNDFPRKALFMSEIDMMDSKISARLDYFGNKKSWTPNFSFAVNYKTFQKEVKSAITTLFYTHLLSLNIVDVENKKESIISFQKNLLDEALETSKKLNSYIDIWESLTSKVEDLEVAEKEFQIELEILESEIRILAKKNIRIPFMEKAVGFLATASKVIPVGQPTFGLVGSGVETLYGFTQSENLIKDILNMGPSLIKDFNQMDYRAAQKELNQQLRLFTPENLASYTKAQAGESSVEKVQRIKNEIKKKRSLVKEMIGFYKPIYESINSQTKMYRTQEISKSALHKEINKIRKSHRIYNKVIKKLKKLITLKSKVRNEMVKVGIMFTQGVNRITANYLTISDLYTELSEDVNLNKEELNQTLKRYKRNASDRLLYYHYRLSKSFEYKTLRSYKRSLSLENVFNSIIQLIEIGDRSLTPQDLDKLMTIFREELSEVFSDLMDYYERVGESTTLTKSFYLSSAEIEALNSGDHIYLNLLSHKSFGIEKNNIRVQGVSILPKYAIGRGISEIRVTHDDLSIISNDVGSYVFAHDSNQKKNYWVASTDLRSKETVQGSIATEDLDIINTVFDTQYPLSKLYVNPSARSYYLIEKLGDADSVIKELEVEIKYSYQY
jgi:hypothetical protein